MAKKLSILPENIFKNIANVLIFFFISLGQIVIMNYFYFPCLIIAPT